MKIERVEVLVEEPSMEAALQILLPRLLATISFQIHPFQCKAELLKHLPARLQAYRRWLPDNWRILVVVDRDQDDCLNLKRSLQEMAHAAGFSIRDAGVGAPCLVVNRLAIEELEAWYFGDWAAVRMAYPRVSATIPQKKGYRDPDSISGGTWEAFERILQKAGYFKTGLRKVEAARAIGPHMDPIRNTSHSFRVLCDALAKMTRQ